MTFQHRPHGSTAIRTGFGFVAFALGSVLAHSALFPCVRSSSTGSGSETPQAGGEDEPEVEEPAPLPPAPPGVPPIPEPSFSDPQLAADFATARKMLDEGAYADAKKLLSKWKGKGANGDEEAAIQRCLLEVEGRLELSDIEEQIAKGKLRPALAKLDKVLPRFAKTLAGEAMAARRGDVFGALYFLVADFEPKPPGAADDSPAPPPMGGEMGAGSGYGLNTKIVGTDAGPGAVRKGEKALRWKTGDGASFISFANVKEHAQDYRWLNISIKSDDPKRRPSLSLLFDCMEGLPGWTPGGRGWDALTRREGFHMNILPEGEWQDLRLDLKKFHPRGDAKWEEVLALRVVHMPGVEATIFVDHVTLERE